MKAIWNGAVVAESDDIQTVEGNAYFPVASLRLELTRPSAHHTTCGWKGVASYYHLCVEGKVNENAVWYYPDPKPDASAVRDRVAFWRGVSVVA